MPRRAVPCPYRSASALRRPDFQRSRALHRACLHEFARAGHANLFDGAVRETALAAVVVSRTEHGQASEEMRGLFDRLGAFVKFCRRNPEWVRTEISRATKANGASD